MGRRAKAKTKGTSKRTVARATPKPSKPKPRHTRDELGSSEDFAASQLIFIRRVDLDVHDRGAHDALVDAATMLEMSSYVEPEHAERFDRAAIILRALAGEFAPTPNVSKKESALLADLAIKLMRGSGKKRSKVPRKSPAVLHFEHTAASLEPYEPPSSEAQALALAERIVDAVGSVRTGIARQVDLQLARKSFFDPLPRSEVCNAIAAWFWVKPPGTAAHAVVMALRVLGYPKPENFDRG